MQMTGLEKPLKAGVQIERNGIIVLHVDDEIAFLKSAKQILQMMGFNVDTALSVKEALKKTKASFYDVIISDYYMPDKNGLDLLEELRNNGKKTPFFLLTVGNQYDIMKDTRMLNVDRFFNKLGDPGTVFDHLATAIRQAVANRHLPMF
jgi:DNA-binding NtrC family response regulator